MHGRGGCSKPEVYVQGQGEERMAVPHVQRETWARLACATWHLCTRAAWCVQGVCAQGTLAGRGVSCAVQLCLARRVGACTRREELHARGWQRAGFEAGTPGIPGWMQMGSRCSTRLPKPQGALPAGSAWQWQPPAVGAWHTPAAAQPGGSISSCHACQDSHSRDSTTGEKGTKIHVFTFSFLCTQLISA